MIEIQTNPTLRTDDISSTKHHSWGNHFQYLVGTPFNTGCATGINLYIGTKGVLLLQKLMVEREDPRSVIYWWHTSVYNYYKC
jgi:hypothetical protein